MKKSRTLIIALLLVATLCVGIGYAAFSSNLKINGEALLPGVTESQVVFTAAAKTAGDDNVTVNIPAIPQEGTKSLDVDVMGFTAAGQSATITATISNPHPFEVALTTPEILFTQAGQASSTTNEYFKVEIVGDAPTSIAAAADGVDGTATLVFKVTSKVIGVHADATTVNFTINLFAQAGAQQTN